jgi:uncharacterized OsmC-like protein
MARLCHSDRFKVKCEVDYDRYGRARVRGAGSFHGHFRARAVQRPQPWVQNGCPGEAINPAELFLSGVAACGAELVQVLAKAQAVPLHGIAADIRGTVDRSRPVRPDVSLFNSVRLNFLMKGVTEQQGRKLVESFKGR